MRKNHSRQRLGQDLSAIDQLTTLPSPTTLRKVEFLFEEGSSTSSSASKAAACTIDSDSWINSSIASMVGHETQIDGSREDPKQVCTDEIDPDSSKPNHAGKDLGFSTETDREDEMWKMKSGARIQMRQMSVGRERSRDLGRKFGIFSSVWEG